MSVAQYCAKRKHQLEAMIAPRNAAKSNGPTVVTVHLTGIGTDEIISSLSRPQESGGWGRSIGLAPLRGPAA